MIKITNNKLQNDLSRFFGIKKLEEKFNDEQKVWESFNYVLGECNTIVVWNISFDEDFLLKQKTLNKTKIIEDNIKNIHSSCKYYLLNSDLKSYDLGFYDLDKSSISSLEENYKGNYHEIYTTLYNENTFNLLKQLILKFN